MNVAHAEAPKSTAEGSKLFILYIIAVATSFRFYRLANQSFGSDEGVTLNLTKSVDLIKNANQLLGMNTGGERFQPLYNLTMPYWRHAFGDSEFAVRSFSTLVSIGAVALIVLTAYYLFGRVHAIWTGVLAATSSFAVYYSQEARPYALLLFFSSAQVFCLTPILASWGEEKSVVWWRRAHVVVVAIGAFCSLFFCLFSTALALSHLIVFRTPKQWLRWWLPAVIAALPAFVFYVAGGQAVDPANRITVARWGYPVFESAAFVIYGVLVGTTYGPSLQELHGANRWAAVRHHAFELVVLAVVVLSMVAMLVRILWRGETGSPQAQRASVFLLLSALLGLGLTAVLAIVTGVTWLPRHSSFLLISVTLLIPLLAGVSSQGHSWLGAGLILLFIGLNLYSLYKYEYVYDYSRDDNRGVARYVMAPEHRQTPSILAYGNITALRHYGDNRTFNATSFSPQKLMERIAENEGDTLVILNHEEFWLLQHGASLPALLSPMLVSEVAAEFRNLKVYRVFRKGTKADRSKNAPIAGIGVPLRFDECLRAEHHINRIARKHNLDRLIRLADGQSTPGTSIHIQKRCEGQVRVVYPDRDPCAVDDPGHLSSAIDLPARDFLAAFVDRKCHGMIDPAGWSSSRADLDEGMTGAPVAGCRARR